MGKSLRTGVFFLNELAKTEAFALLCGYAMGSFYKDTAQGDVTRLHTHVVSDNGAALRVN